MAKVFSDRIIVALDVGTTKICVLVAEKISDDYCTIIGIGKAPSEGLKKGIVINMGQTIQSIKAAVKEAELMSGISIGSAYVGISGSHIHSTNSPGMVPIKKGSVRAEDMQAALAAARAIPIAQGQQILHVMAQYYTIDHQEKIMNPIGLCGVRLEVLAHIILGATASVTNLARCCEQAGVQVQDVVLEPLASAQAVLSPDEQELGTAILDIGGGTSDFAIYHDGAIAHTMVIPVAGWQFTRDIAIGLRTTIHDAERVKKEYGIVDPAFIQNNISFEVDLTSTTDKHSVNQEFLTSILHARTHELFVMIKQEIDTHHLHGLMPSGLVLTGGGSLLQGIESLAQSVLAIPVRKGIPRIHKEMPVILKSPIYATAYGLLMYALNKYAHRLPSQEPLAKKILTSMRSWVSDFF